jgi:hypothetical protein
MTEPELDLQTLAKRLEKVEKQNWRLCLIGGLVLTLIIAFFLVRQFIPNPRNVEVEAERFVIRDKDGKYYGGLGLGLANDENPKLLLYQSEEAVVSLDFYDLRFVNMKDVLNSTILGRQGLLLSLPKKTGGMKAIQLYFDDDGQPNITLMGKKIMATLGSLELERKDGTKIKHPLSLAFINEKGKVIWKAPLED